MQVPQAKKNQPQYSKRSKLPARVIEVEQVDEMN